MIESIMMLFLAMIGVIEAESGYFIASGIFALAAHLSRLMTTVEEVEE